MDSVDIEAEFETNFMSRPIYNKVSEIVWNPSQIHADP